MTAHDPASFSAGHAAGTRVAACVARLAALELMEHSRWWNRRRHLLMAGALIAHAEEMEDAADEPRCRAAAPPREANLRAVPPPAQASDACGAPRRV